MSPSRFWGITTFYNPCGYRSRVANFRLFRRRNRAQGLPLIAVELAFGDQPFRLEKGKDAEILVQRRTSSVLWHKERLLNIALEHLPPECELVSWLDADVLFEQDEWIAQCVDLLARYPVIQPFLHAIRLPRGGTPANFPGSEIGKAIPNGEQEGEYRSSFAADLSRLGQLQRYSSDGYAWCATREILDSIGFYDRCIIGGGAREFALATFFSPSRIPPENVRVIHKRLREDIAPWGRRLYEAVQGRISFAPLTVHHLWHGDVKNRQYVSRHEVLQRFDFDPRGDVGLDFQGCLRWTTEKAGLIEAVKSYFEIRREDG